jgi:hypothetical protein
MDAPFREGDRVVLDRPAHRQLFHNEGAVEGVVQPRATDPDWQVSVLWPNGMAVEAIADLRHVGSPAREGARYTPSAADAHVAALEHQRLHGGRLAELPLPMPQCPRCPPRAAKDPRRVYSWAVPTNEALDAIVEHAGAGVVEIGAGSGYWARLLANLDVDVAAYDVQPWPNPHPEQLAWQDGVTPWHVRSWFPVRPGNHRAVVEHPDRALLMVWPSAADWAAEAVEHHTGETVIVVGEWRGGQTGSDRLFDLLDGMQLVADVALPCWYGCTDRLRVFQ